MLMGCCLFLILETCTYHVFLNLLMFLLITIHSCNLFHWLTTLDEKKCLRIYVWCLGFWSLRECPCVRSLICAKNTALFIHPVLFKKITCNPALYSRKKHYERKENGLFCDARWCMMSYSMHTFSHSFCPYTVNSFWQGLVLKLQALVKNAKVWVVKISLSCFGLSYRQGKCHLITNT